MSQPCFWFYTSQLSPGTGRKLPFNGKNNRENTNRQYHGNYRLLLIKIKGERCRRTDVGRRFTCALPVIFSVTDRCRLSKTSYCTFGHDHILKCPNVQWTYIHTYRHLDKDMDPVRGRKSYFVHNMRQDVAILCSKYNTNSDKACFGPAPEGER